MTSAHVRQLGKGLLASIRFQLATVAATPELTVLFGSFGAMRKIKTHYREEF